MRKNLLIPFLILTGLLIASCDKVHDPIKPDPETPDIRTTVRLYCMVTISEFEIMTRTGAPDSTSVAPSDVYDRRYIICFTPSEDTSKQKVTQVITRDISDTSEMAINARLSVQKYDLTIWMDYVPKGTGSDLFYDTQQTTSLETIHIPSPEAYVASNDFKDCQFFSTDVDLRPYAGYTSATITVNAELKRPVAKFRLLASDLPEYAKSIGYVGDLAELAAGITFDVSYEGFFPTGFNAFTGRLNDSQTGYGFKSTGSYPFKFKNEDCVYVGSDHVLLNGTSTVTVSVVARSSTGAVISRVVGQILPVTRDYETVMVFPFLTKSIGGDISVNPGFGIDPGFDGEFDVYY